ncbi:hypothetical protein [Candidatus Nitrosopumilus sediminis]|uniref:Uncharacterized protein n=1 Tax=Candidatus Nitrosopumilus sediminis TaxID=1229909 RepID=K0BFB4_9ARCH|nr:hypothetical protein [Candidatus Nitrosopumilus sediminis]AFS82981.1 hypothetical protein NSED_05895 [Candidatus Nitrosopumilus sediminis]
MNLKILFILIGFFLILPINFVHAEVIHENLGIINELLVSEEKSDLYFFELDQNISSQTWIHDTKIMYGNENTISKISDDLFIFPTEINEIGDYLIFATLSEECVGNTICDFQDVIKMSKKDGSYQKIIHQLKSAIHISVEGEQIYLSESNGKIWKFFKDGSDKQLVYQGNNIIMDITVQNDKVYWIEEISEQNSIIMMLKDGIVTKIAENLQIPYNLAHDDDSIFWNEIRIGAKSGKVTEFTKFTLYNGDKIKTVSEYDNKTPLSSFSKPVYGPYSFLGNFLFIANNTSDKSTIHLLDYKTDQNFELETISNYDVRYFRNSFDSLYVLGQNQDGFLIEKLPLPVTVPEFSTVMIFFSVTTGLSLIIASQKLFHY